MDGRSKSVVERRLGLLNQSIESQECYGLLGVHSDLLIWTGRIVEDEEMSSTQGPRENPLQAA